MSTKKQSKQPTRKQLIETCQELDKGIECVKGFIEQAEAEMKILSSDGTLSTEGETCLGCRLIGYRDHHHAVVRTCLKQNDKLEEQIKEAEKKNKDLADFSEASVEGMFAIKKENEELKSQIPDKKGKKLSQKDKEALEEILHNIEHPYGTEDHHNDGGGSFYEAKVNLLKRLLK